MASSITGDKSLDRDNYIVSIPDIEPGGRILVSRYVGASVVWVSGKTVIT